MLKYAFNLADDSLVGQRVFAGEAMRLAYSTVEAAEGRDAFLEGRQPDFSGWPWYYWNRRPQDPDGRSERGVGGTAGTAATPIHSSVLSSK